MELVPARVRARVASRRHAAAWLRRPSGPSGLSGKISIGGWPSNAGSVVVSGSARVSLSRANAYHRIAARYVLLAASWEIRELSLAHYFEHGGVCHFVKRSKWLFKFAALAARTWGSPLGLVLLEYHLHLKSMRFPPPSSFDLRCAAVHRAEPCLRGRTRQLRTGGNARAHGQALPLPPPPAPVRHGRGRIAGLSCGRSVLPRLFALFVSRGLGLELVGRGLSFARFRLRCFVGILEVHRAHLAAIVLLDVVADALILAETAHSSPLDGGNVDEGVIAAAVRSDEAIALRFVEELYGSCGHLDFPSKARPQISPLRARSEKRRKRSRKAPENRQFATSSNTIHRRIPK